MQNLKVGDIVLFGSDNKVGKGDYRLARVCDVNLDDDGLARDVMVEFRLFREALQKTGVNINPILLRLKDRENAENDRNFDRRSINFPLFEMEFLRNWFGNPAQGR